MFIDELKRETSMSIAIMDGGWIERCWCIGVQVLELSLFLKIALYRYTIFRRNFPFTHLLKRQLLYFHGAIKQTSVQQQSCHVRFMPIWNYRLQSVFHVCFQNAANNKCHNELKKRKKIPANHSSHKDVRTHPLRFVHVVNTSHF
jgi:hypothetical protein